MKPQSPIKQMLQIAPSILTANFLSLGSALKAAEQAGVDILHLDIMDGVFVPNISFGSFLVETIRKHTNLCLDVHLMITEPSLYIDAFAKAGAQIITVHLEACTHLHRTIAQIKSKGCQAGVALNPSTPVLLLKDILCEIDVVLLMSVNPGFGGQSFIEHTFAKLQETKALINEGNHRVQIEIDGGVSKHNIATLENLGADICVVGSALYNAEPFAQNLHALKALLSTTNDVP